MEKRYLGDGVYVEADDETLMLKLTTEDGIQATNTIYLEPDVLDALGRYAQDWIYKRNRREPCPLEIAQQVARGQRDDT